jgi:hypothetical protein
MPAMLAVHDRHAQGEGSDDEHAQAVRKSHQR